MPEINGLLRSDEVHRMIDELLISGQAQSASEAEERFLDEHLEEIAKLAENLPASEFREHEAVKLLMSHGSRPWEDEFT